MTAMRPRPLILRRALGTAIGVVIAVLVDRYLSRMQEYWVPLTTLLVMQMTIRTNLRLALQRFLIILVSVFLATWLVAYLRDLLLSQVILVTAFILSCYLHNKYTLRGNPVSTYMLIAIVFLILLIPYPSFHPMYAQMSDVLLGGAIGIISGLIFYPGRADVDFRIGVIAILKSYEEYLKAIGDLFFQQNHAEDSIILQKKEVSRVLQIQQAFFPDWVYESGFNPALREGHRYFLLRVEEAGALLFAMQHIARKPVDPELLEKLRQPLTNSIDQTIQIMKALVTLLELKNLKEPLPDFAEDMQTLESKFKEAVPLPLELLDISENYMLLTAFIYDLKDLQKTLLKLAEALSSFITEQQESH